MSVSVVPFTPFFFTRPRPVRPLPWPTRVLIFSSSSCSSVFSESVGASVIDGGASSKLASNASSSSSDSHVRKVTPWIARHSPVAMSSSPSFEAISGEPPGSTSESFRDSEMTSTDARRQSRFSPGLASTVTSTRIRRFGSCCVVGLGLGFSLMGPAVWSSVGSGVRCENPN